MKDFFKFTLATITGIVVSCILLFLFIVISIFGLAASSSSTDTVVRENSLLVLNLNGKLQERAQETPIEEIAKIFGNENQKLGLDDILAAIKNAKENDKIKGIYLKPTSLSTSYASLQEIRKALIDFKESGKFIVAYNDNYSQSMYYLASAADKVLLNPQGNIDWRGIASTPMFYKNALDKIGIKMQIFKVGTYKSAVEPYNSTHMSEANREQIDTYISTIWDQLLTDVSESRGISKDKLNEYANEAIPFLPSEKNIEYQLADTLIYKNNVDDYIKKMMDLEEDDHFRTLGITEAANIKANIPKDKSGNIIAIYYAEGGIVDINPNDNQIAIVGNKMARDLKRLKDNEDIKAVVLRVNSPGGSAFASEQIWHAVKELKEEKPVIVSMGDYAASGGYYISCVADTIVAEPTTLTGSIGIFGMVPEFEEISRKIGLTHDVVKTNTFSDFGNLMRPFNKDERALLQMKIEEGYHLFVKRCAEGRGMTPEEINAIAQGRVWTGKDALDKGLIDVLGTIETAKNIAVEKANIESYTLMTYPEIEDGLWASIFSTSPIAVIKAQLLEEELGSMYQHYNFIKNLNEKSLIQARVPFDLNIN